LILGFAVPHPCDFFPSQGWETTEPGNGGFEKSSIGRSATNHTSKNTPGLEFTFQARRVFGNNSELR
jgi:hypothetical protein